MRNGMICLFVIIVLVGAVFYVEGQTIKYESKGKRDPFVPLVGVDKDKVSGLEDVLSVEDIQLEGIAIGPGGKNVAMLNGRMVKENDKIGILTIRKITNKKVVLLVGDKEYILNLQEPGGQKSEQ